MNFSIRTTVVVVAALAGPVHADFITTKFGSGTPVDSWAYSKAEGVGHGNSTTYMPIIADWGGAVFQSYVFQSTSEVWNTVGSGVADEDTIYVFKTFVLSSSDVVIPLRLGGDDGHSIYVNDVFIGGGGFAANIDFDLTLTAGIPVKVELGNYNGPGAMIADLFRRDNRMNLDTTSGVEINANGFSAVPEPSSAILLAIGFAGVLSGALARRQVWPPVVTRNRYQF